MRGLYHDEPVRGAEVHHRTVAAVPTGRSWLRAEGGAGDGPPVEFEPEAGKYALRVGDADFAVDDVILGGHVELDPAGAAL
ncbi:hypothetical protein GCM10023191_072740 [Actinoallomurus oryzae]|uniref:Uncharacterized protein n=1 Tax=Actinoallomurus oryzae TaxID=502180 RepID=A0ABP8QV53_9ACTN